LTDSASVEWWRFDGDGLYEGVVSVPGTFTPTAVRGNLVLGVHRDGMDVESVRVYRFRVAGTARGDGS
jgi:hypothetical protein